VDFAPAPQLTTYRVFLSSADSPPLRALRDRVEHVIDRIVREQLMWANEPIRFETQRWETVAAQRTQGTPLEHFVAAAVRSQLMVVLLVDEIRSGTKKELWSVLSHPDPVQVAVLRFTEKNENDANEDTLGRYLKWIRSRHRLIIKTLTTGLNTNAVWNEVLRTAVAALIAGYTAERDAERRRLDEIR